MGQNFDNRILNYADFIIKFRWLVIALTVLVTIFAATGAKNLGFSTNYRVFFSKANPELTTFESFQNTYTKNDNIMFVIQPKDKNIKTADVAAAIEEITTQSWQIPYTIRVDSITNFQHSWAEGDDMTVDDLIRDGADMSQAELNRKGEIAKDEPLLYGNLLAVDQEATGVNATFLKDCEAVIPNYLVELSAERYIAEGYIEDGYIEEQQ